jgi:hypothetical protein
MYLACWGCFSITLPSASIRKIVTVSMFCWTGPQFTFIKEGNPRITCLWFCYFGSLINLLLVCWMNLKSNYFHIHVWKKLCAFFVLYSENIHQNLHSFMIPWCVPIRFSHYGQYNYTLSDFLWGIFNLRIHFSNFMSQGTNAMEANR